MTDPVKTESTTETTSQPPTTNNINGGGSQPHFANQRRDGPREGGRGGHEGGRGGGRGGHEGGRGGHDGGRGGHDGGRGGHEGGRGGHEGGRGGHEGGRGGHEGGRGGHEGGRGGHDGGRGGYEGGRGGRFGGKRRNQGNFENKPRFNRGGDNQQQGGGEFNPQRQNERIMYDKLMEMANNPTFDLPPLDNEEKKFSGRSRLYIGNIPNDVDDEEIIDMFKIYGETSELFLNREKNFGFIRIDYHFNAERAKNELNGKVLKGRTLKIRFAPNSSTIKVKNLDEYVTNELLYQAFSVFGEVDRAVVIVDDHGKSIGEGIVEFARKNTAQFALRKCNEGCFFLTSSVRPVFVEPYEALDEMDGYADKFVPKRNPEFAKQRKVGPRFAQPDSFEQEYGMRWKQLHDLYKQKVEALKKEQEIEQEKLLAQMEFARYEHETAMLREQLRAREMDMGRQKREWEMKEQQAEESRRRTEEQMRRQQEEMESRMLHQEEEMRRRSQENNLFMQAQLLDNMLKDQTGYEEPHDAPAMEPESSKPYMNTYERRGFEGGHMRGRGGGSGHMGGRGNWGNDSFSSKRRRY